MKSSRSLVVLLATLLLSSFGALLVQHSFAINSAQRARPVGDTSSIESREAAYRANNLGVALLEQFKAREAADSFRQALRIKPDLQIARVNLSIALYYLPDSAGARREAEGALDDASAYATAARVAGVDVTPELYLDMPHNFFKFANPISLLAIERVADWIGANSAA